MSRNDAERMQKSAERNECDQKKCLKLNGILRLILVKKERKAITLCGERNYFSFCIIQIPGGKRKKETFIRIRFAT